MALLPAPQFSRKAAAWLMAAALLTVTAYASLRTVQLHREMAKDQEKRVQAQLASTLEVWEHYVADQSQRWLLELTTTSDMATYEQRSRELTGWFDAAYVWETGEKGVRLLQPLPPVTEDVAAFDRLPCLRASRRIAALSPPELGARAWRMCSIEGAGPRMYSTGQAASLFLQAGLPQEALDTLTEVEPGLAEPLARARARGLATPRLVQRRTLAAEAMEALGMREQRKWLLRRTVEEITSLEATELEPLLPLAAQIVKEGLSDAPKEQLSTLDRRIGRASRRLNGWREVRDRLIPRLGAAPDTEAPNAEALATSLRFASEIYSDSDLLLVYAPIGDRRYAAVQLDGEQLLSSLVDMARVPEGHLVVLSADGAVLAADGGLTVVGEGDLLASQAFGMVFPHLRLGLVGSAPTQVQGAWTLFIQLLPILGALVLGVVALLGRRAADAQQRELITRQQDFVARVTHELKTPLAGIRLMAETLELGLGDDPDTRSRFLGRILTETRRLEERIDDVLRVARARSPGRRTEVEPHELIGQVVDRWRPRFEDAGATLEDDISPCPTLSADKELLEDAFSNLLDNALKYRREDVPLRCRVRAMVDSSGTVVEVTDNGIGVPPAQRKTIFERFARVERGARGKAGGHGLGLSFVAEAMRAHGGVVECREGFDGGARFILRFRRS